MKKILINAISIKEGGGVVVLTRMLNELCLLEKNIHWIVVVDDVLRDKINLNHQVTILTFPWVKKSVLHFLYWNEVVLSNLIRSLQIKCFFSHTNILPILKLPCPTLLLVQHTGYFSDEFMKLHFKYHFGIKNKITFHLRRLLVINSVRKADRVTVQTDALAKKITNQLDINNNKIIIIPHGPGLAQGKVFQKTYVNKKKWRIGYITKYGVQKNFETLFKAMALLKSQMFHCVLILTLDENHMPYQYVKQLITQYDITDMIENHGEVNEVQVQKLYESLDLFIFPSLCESFGFTLVEAMYYGLPIIAADTNSNREIIGDHGEFFKSNDFLELKNKIIFTVTQELNYIKMSTDSIKRSNLYSWKNTANRILYTLENL